MEIDVRHGGSPGSRPASSRGRRESPGHRRTGTRAAGPGAVSVQAEPPEGLGVGVHDANSP